MQGQGLLLDETVSAAGEQHAIQRGERTGYRKYYWNDVALQPGVATFVLPVGSSRQLHCGDQGYHVR